MPPEQVDLIKRLLQYLPEDTDYAQFEAYLTPICSSKSSTDKHFQSILPGIASLIGIQSAHDPNKKSIFRLPVPQFYRLSGWLIALLFGAIGFLVLQLSTPTIEGCMDPHALNYNPRASIPTTNCIYAPTRALHAGCMDTEAINIEPMANVSCPTCCVFEACLDPKAINYNPEASKACTDCCQYYSTRLPGALKTAAGRDLSYFPVATSKQAASPPDITAIQNQWYWKLYFQRKRISVVALAIMFGLLLTLWLYRRAWIESLEKRTYLPTWPYRPQLLSTSTASNTLIKPIISSFKPFIERRGPPNMVPFSNYSEGPHTYLLLIDHHGQQDHRAWFYDQVAQQFKQAGVSIQHYFFTDRPLVFWNDKHRAGIPLETLLDQFEEAQVIIFSEGTNWVDPFRQELEYWADRFKFWKNRVWMTPIPLESWGNREFLIAQQFKIIPPSNWGFEAILKPAQDFEFKREWINSLRPHAISPLPVIDAQNAKEVVFKHFPEKIRKWIAACCIYSELHPLLTLEIGHQVLGADFINNSDWLLLLQLPWFENGYIPDPIRQSLIPILTPTEQADTHQVIHKYLEGTMPLMDTSFAKGLHEVESTTHQLLKKPQHKRTQDRWFPKLHFLQFLGLPIDRTNLDIITKRTAYQPILSKSLKPDRSLTNFRIYALVAFIIALATMLWRAPLNGKLDILDSNLYHIANPKDSLDFITNRAWLAIQRDQLTDVAAITKMVNHNPYFQGQLASYQDTIYQRNIQLAQYERASRAYQRKHFANALQWLNQPVFDPVKSNGDLPFAPHYWHLLGLTYWQLGQLDSARLQMNRIERLNPEYWQQHAPNLKLALNYEFVDSLQYGRIRIRQNRQYQFLDNHGQSLTNQFDFAYPYQTTENLDAALTREDTVALIYHRGQYQFVGPNGDFIPQTNFKRLLPVQCGNGLWGYTNSKDAPVIACRFEQAWPFPTNQELAKVAVAGKIGYIGRNGVYGVAPIYEEGDDFVGNRANVRLNDQWGYIDATGHVVIPFRFDSAEPFRNGTAQVEIGNTRFRIDEFGRCLSGNNCPVASFTLKIMERTSLRPVANATVNHPIYGKLTTDETGVIKLQLLEHLLPRQATFSIEAAGFVTEEIALTLAAGQSIPTIYLDRVQ